MIKANDLRIGNFLIFKTYVKPETTIAVDSELLHKIANSDLYSDTYCNPIPLTAEWLLKFGFEFPNNQRIETGSTNYWIKNGFTLSMGDWGKGFHFGFEISHGCINNSVMIYHVHQLQNLYFALKGEDLTIKENATPVQA